MSKGNMLVHEVDEISLVLSDLPEAEYTLSGFLHKKPIQDCNKMLEA